MEEIEQVESGPQGIGNIQLQLALQGLCRASNSNLLLAGGPGVRDERRTNYIKILDAQDVDKALNYEPQISCHVLDARDAFYSAHGESEPEIGERWREFLANFAGEQKQRDRDAYTKQLERLAGQAISHTTRDKR